MPELRKLHDVFVAEVGGIDLTRPTCSNDIAFVEAAIAEYAVLVFRDQRITDEQQLAFSRSFGDLEETRGTGISKPGEQRLHPAFADVSNLDTDNTVLARDNRRRLYSLGNIRYCRAASWWSAGEKLSSPTCARRTMRSTLKRKPKSPIWSANIR
jgi:hypothetical protein